MRLHLFLCKWGRRYRRQLHLLHNALQQDPNKLAECPPVKLPPESRERLTQLIVDGEHAAQARQDTGEFKIETHWAT